MCEIYITNGITTLIMFAPNYPQAFFLRSTAKYCPTQVLMTAYYGLIYPHRTYGVVLSGACTNNRLTRVFKLQKQEIRIIAHLNFRESCRETFK
ncbi:hypothetical protein J6590_062650 [Homalodisca vitripennis]|nr:hypothetical protein J6590_062650 [Homalodisca vitripennis]